MTHVLLLHMSWREKGCGGEFQSQVGRVCKLLLHAKRCSRAFRLQSYGKNLAQVSTYKQDLWWTNGFSPLSGDSCFPLALSAPLRYGSTPPMTLSGVAHWNYPNRSVSLFTWHLTYCVVQSTTWNNNIWQRTCYRKKILNNNNRCSWINRGLCAKWNKLNESNLQTFFFVLLFYVFFESADKDTEKILGHNRPGRSTTSFPVDPAYSRKQGYFEFGFV